MKIATTNQNDKFDEYNESKINKIKPVQISI
jgi:hypothetical protein